MLRKVRKNGLAHFLRERLTLVHILLPVTFSAVTENFVKEDRRSAACQECRADSRIV